MEISIKYYVVELILRVFCGVIFMFQGYDKVFKVKIRGVIETFRYEAQQKNMPSFLLTFSAYYTSYVEFFGGILLILGLFKNYALTFLGLDMIMVAIAFSYLKPMWDMRFVFPRLILIAILLILPTRWAYFSLDNLLRILLAK